MAKRSVPTIHGIVDDGLESEVSSEYTVVEQSMGLRSKYPATIKMTGQVTGKQYIWDKSGSVVEVDVRDYPALIGMRMGSRFCCGDGNMNYMFELVIGG